jgi:vacuolar protein sorting-associated protein 11
MQAPPKTLAHVHRHFGDFLYSKRDYDGAAMEYIATIGWLEPSHAIQRFLQPQRATNLTAYLKVLHERGLATADHTTILLTCYAKLKQVDAIEDFLQRARAVGGGDSAFHLDAHAAVAALRNAGLGNMTLAAAEVSEDPQLRLEVLVRDCRRASDGLAFLKTLGRRRAAEALKRYGKELLDAEPVGTTATLMELCLPISPSHSASASDEDSNFVANFAEFTHLYADRPDDLRYACMTILAMGESAMDSSSRQALYHTLLDLYLTCNGQSVPHSKEEKQALEEGAGAPGRTSPPNDDSGRAAALDLLQRGWAPGSEPAYDVARALTACRLHSFAAGLVFLYTNLRMYRDAAAVLADNSDWEGLLELCERYGNAPSGGDPEVWRDALERLSSPAAGPSSAGPLRKLLARIETAAVLPPLAVLPVLARNPHLKLDLVKDYVTRALEAENRAIVHDLDEAKRLQAEVEEAENAVKRLTIEPVVFQASRDAQTGAPLELPSVHFLCGHSFNLRTLGDGVESGSAQCPLCAPETRRLEELQRSHRAAAADKDSFFKQLRAAPDGFALITEYFGKGMLNNSSSSV